MGGLFSKKGGADLQRVIVVFGATGAQGGSVLRALVEDKSFLVRAVTRNPESDKAKALAELGVDVVQADMDDIESLKTAMQGAYGVFAVTNYWENMDKEKETQQGKLLVDAAIASDVKHFVYSGLADVNSDLGKECAHYDSKAAVVKYIKEQDIPHTIVKYSFYYENFLTFFKLKKNEEDVYILDIPMDDAPLHMICAEEAGECIHQIFRCPKKHMGKEIGLSSDLLKIEDIIHSFSKHLPDKKFAVGKGKQLVDAAIATDVKHFVYSGQDAVNGVLGKECPFFDSKAPVVEYIKEKGITHTIVKYAFYYENFLTIGKPVKNEEEIYMIDIPMGNAGLHMICVEESGKSIHKIFKDSKKYIGKDIILTSDQVTSQEIVETFSKHFPDRKFALGTKSTNDMGILGVMFEYLATDTYTQSQDHKINQKLNCKIPNFEKWVESHKDVIAAACD